MNFLYAIQSLQRKIDDIDNTLLYVPIEHDRININEKRKQLVNAIIVLENYHLTVNTFLKLT